MLAMTFHPLAYLLEWSSPFQIGFQERLVVVYLEQIHFLKRLDFILGEIGLSLNGPNFWNNQTV
jgi:hypothetical protein